MFSLIWDEIAATRIVKFILTVSTRGVNQICNEKVTFLG